MTHPNHLPAMPQPPGSGARALALPGEAALMQHAMPGHEQTMLSGDNILSFRQLWRSVLKHRWMILGITAVCGLAATTYTLRQTPQYQSVAVLQIDRAAKKVVGFNTEMEVDEGALSDQVQLRTQVELLSSRSLAERVIDELGLYQTRSGEPLPGEQTAETSPLPGEPSQAEKTGFMDRIEANVHSLFNPSVSDQEVLDRTQTIAAFQRAVHIEPLRNSRLVEIKVTNSDATLSARIANTMAQAYIAANLERKVDSSQYARQYLENQIASTKAKLEESERVINDYAKRNEILNLGENESATTRNFVDFSSALAKAEQERIRAEALYNEVRTNPDSAPAVLDNLAIQAYKEEKARQEAEYAKNLAIYKPDFPKMQQTRAQIERLDQRIRTEVAMVLQSIRSQYVAAKSQEEKLRSKVNQSRDEVLAVQDRSVDLNLLQRELDTNRQVYDSLLQRLKEVSVTAGITTNNVSIVDEAQAPLFPDRPRPLINLGMGLVGGLFLGVIAALLREQLDDSVKRADEIEQTFGIPLLGWIPQTKTDSGKSNESVALLAHTDPRSAFAEAYRSMRTALQFSTADGAPRRLMVTSCGKGEGKTTSALALAINFAQLGRKVLLIDADMRKPAIHKALRMPNERGLSNALTGNQVADGLIQPCKVPSLSVLTSGPTPPDPVELLMGPKLGLLLDKADEMGFDHVIIDGPPLLGIADAIVLGNQIHHMVFAIKASSTKKQSIRDALRRLRHAGVVPMGAVLTQARSEHLSDYGYESYYGYGDLAEAAPEKLAQPAAGGRQPLPEPVAG
ncbi:polysaccharide biosynthesis tyrosine autokinase [Hydrogenophaga sp. 5NK40-0174]|uniref:GumC family protein n=1 Tax=Hydrogenophaga sp. 5NK40-0174 TaxID=3127649 RepID=UPI00310B5819